MGEQAVSRRVRSSHFESARVQSGSLGLHQAQKIACSTQKLHPELSSQFASLSSAPNSNASFQPSLSSNHAASSTDSSWTVSYHCCLLLERLGKLCKRPQNFFKNSGRLGVGAESRNGASTGGSGVVVSLVIAREDIGVVDGQRSGIGSRDRTDGRCRVEFEISREV